MRVTLNCSNLGFAISKALNCHLSVLKILLISTVSIFIFGCSGISDKKDTLPEQNAPFKEKGELKSVKVKPELRENGIFFGDKGLVLDGKGMMRLMSGGRKIGDFFFYFSTPYSPWITTNYGGLKNSKWDIKLSDNKYLFTAEIPLDKKNTANMPYGHYKQKVKVLEDGKIKVDMEYSVPKGLEKNLKSGYMFFRMPFTICQGKNYEINGKDYVFPEISGDKGLNVYSGRPESFSFTPDDPATKFDLKIGGKQHFFIKDRKNSIMSCGITPYGKTRKVSFTLDLTEIAASSLEKSSDCHAGIDFWKNDRLHVPDFSKSINLIQNPSFEAGLRYYILHDTWGVYKKSDVPIYSTDNSESKFGNSSLLVIARKDNPREGLLQTFSMPVRKGKKYSVSLYVKGDKAKGLRVSLQSISAKWPIFPRIGSCAVTKEWKRHSFTFTAPNNAITILLRGKYNGDGPSGKIWIDGLQLEESDKASEFNEKPLYAYLKTSNPDNFLNLKDKINAELKIVTSPNTEGTIKCEINDYFYRKIWSGDFTFKTDSKGNASVPLLIDDVLRKGIYVLRADFTLSDGYEDTDFFRISRMEFLENKHRHKNICAAPVWSRSARDIEDIAERYKHIGMGSTNYIRPEKKFAEIFKKHSIHIGGLGVFSHGRKASEELNKKMKICAAEVKKWEHMTPEREKIVEDISFETAKSMPWIDSWFFAGECEAGGGSKFKMIDNGNIKDFVKLFMATYRGVKRFDPKKEVYLSGGPCNMMPQNGIRWVDRYLKAVDGKVKFDGIAIHPYRTVPENPDLDADTEVLLEMLGKHGYNDEPVYWNEGIYYTYYNIPEWGLNPHKGCSTDSSRVYCPSYHMGWGERISAAYFARSWLVALKYHDRIKQFNGWSSWIFMDAYMTPLALQKIPNTLGHLLGNAVFKKDIRFAPGVRCYVFEDEKNRPVAAVWSHIAKVDYGYEDAPIAEMAFGDLSPEFIDLMGNENKVDSLNGVVEAAITSFPIFIRTQPGTLDKLCDTLLNAKLKGLDLSPIQISAKPLNESSLDVHLKNLLSKDFAGQLDMGVQNTKIEKPITLKSEASMNFKVPLEKKLATDKITKVDIPISIKEEGEKAIKCDASFEGFAIKKLQGKIVIDGNLDDWKTIPEIKFKNRDVKEAKYSSDKRQKVGYKGDFEASFKMTWDDENLYLAVNVVDDEFVRLPNKKGMFNWYNDTLQVYVDTFCDARSKSIKGFDGNDYEYDFFPDPSKNNAVAFLRFVPEQQIAGGMLAPKPNSVEPNIKNAFKLLKDGYIYEIAIPKRYIAPLQLKAGTVAGFSIYINDRDGKKIKSSLTLTPPETGCYQNPHLFPMIILTD